MGAAVRTYLLERSRVVAVNDPERNYHAFYQLCAGASAEDKARLHLGSAQDYRCAPSPVQQKDRGYDYKTPMHTSSELIVDFDTTVVPSYLPCTWYALAYARCAPLTRSQ